LGGGLESEDETDRMRARLAVPCRLARSERVLWHVRRRPPGARV